MRLLWMASRAIVALLAVGLKHGIVYFYDLGHQTFVNSCDVARRGPQIIVSGSDDGTIRVRDHIKSSQCYFRLPENFWRLAGQNVRRT